MDSNKAAALVLGGIFLGVWLWIALFEVPEWFGWGVFGIVLGAAIYAARLANEVVRITTWVILGLALGMLAMAAVFRETVDIVATLVTFLGSALVASGLPYPGPSTTYAEA